MSNGVMTMVKYVFITVVALIFEVVVLQIYNAIAESYSYSALSGGILAITMPLTVIILLWIGWKEMTGDNAGYEDHANF